MKEIKRFIDVHVPVTHCNLDCHYCYVKQNHHRDGESSPYLYSPQQVKEALSQARLGGLCHFNLCGLGETLLPNTVLNYAYVMLEQGHYLMIVTNGLLKKRFDEIESWPSDLKNRLGFKFSFHYLELKRTNQMQEFFTNARKVMDMGCSISIELMSCDELEPYIDDIQKIMKEELGAKCHLTIPRSENDEIIPLLSKHNLQEYSEIWSCFDSNLFAFKQRIWGEKRNEYCYAGAWSGLLNLGTGNYRACYNSKLVQNIFDNPDKPIKFCAVGKHCQMPHCYNGHSFLSLGTIPEINGVTYADLRNRTMENGKEWLTPEMKAFLTTRLDQTNREFSQLDRLKNEWLRWSIMMQRVARKIRK